MSRIRRLTLSQYLNCEAMGKGRKPNNALPDCESFSYCTMSMMSATTRYRTVGRRQKDSMQYMCATARRTGWHLDQERESGLSPKVGSPSPFRQCSAGSGIYSHSRGEGCTGRKCNGGEHGLRYILFRCKPCRHSNKPGS